MAPQKTVILLTAKTCRNQTPSKMKVHSFLSTILLTTGPFVSCLIFPGPCPELETVGTDFSCISNITSGSYRAAAYLPVDGNTVNLFFNPFVSIDCLELNIQCSYVDNRNIQIRYNCYRTMIGNKTFGIVTQCLPITFDPYRDLNKSSQITK